MNFESPPKLERRLVDSFSHVPANPRRVWNADKFGSSELTGNWRLPLYSKALTNPPVNVPIHSFGLPRPSPRRMTLINPRTRLARSTRKVHYIFANQEKTASKICPSGRLPYFLIGKRNQRRFPSIKSGQMYSY